MQETTAARNGKVNTSIRQYSLWCLSAFAAAPAPQKQQQFAHEQWSHKQSGTTKKFHTTRIPPDLRVCEVNCSTFNMVSLFV